jgi:hypothetical protein
MDVIWIASRCGLCGTVRLFSKEFETSIRKWFEHPPGLPLGPLFAAEQSPPRRGDVGEHWVSHVYVCVTPQDHLPNVVSKVEEVRELRSRPALASSAGITATSLRGSGGEPGNPFLW